MKQGFWLAILAAMTFIQASGAEDRRAEEQLGCLTPTHGGVQVQRSGASIPVLKRLLVRLNDRVLVAAGAEANLTHWPSGKRYLLTPGTSVVGALQLTVSTRPAREAKVVGRFPAGLAPILFQPTPNADKVLGTRGRGVDDDLTEPEPVGAIKELSNPLTLRWKNEIPSGSGKLLITLTRVGEPDPLLSQQLPASAASFPVPMALNPTSAYRWKVSGISAKAGLVDTGGLFWVLSQADRTSLENLEKAAADLRQSGADPGEADLLLGMGYRNLGLFRSALTVWNRIAAADPDDEEAAEQVRRLTEIVSGRRAAGQATTQ